MEAVGGYRPKVVVGSVMAGCLALATILMSLNVASGDLHWNDMPWASGPVASADSVFAEGHPLYCSGIEHMTPAAALAALEAKGYAVRIEWDRYDQTLHMGALPSGAVLQDVGANGTTAFMFVMTADHPRFDEGFFGTLPPQNC